MNMLNNETMTGELAAVQAAVQSAMPTPRFNFDTSARQIAISIGCWTARVKDKSESEKTNREAGAAEGAANVWKDLLAGRQELRDVNKFAAGVRNWLSVATMDWQEPYHLVPVVRIPATMKQAEAYRAEYWQKVEQFLAIYPDLISAQAFALGTMFDRDEYPTVEQLRSRFHFDIDVIPVPSKGDWRVDLMDAAQQDLYESLASQMEANVSKRLSGAMAGLRARFGEHLKRMSEMLVDVVKENKKGETVLANRGYRETMLSGAKQLCRDVVEMNLTGDPALEAARVALERAIDGVEFKELKNNVQIKKDVKKEVDSILSKFDF